MKVKFVNPNNKKFGTTEHIENTTGRTLIALGECEEVALPARGSAGWLAARNEQAATAVPNPADTPAGVAATEWGIQNLRSGKVHIIKRVGSDTFFFDGPPQDCPASIRQQWLDATAVNPEANAVALAAAKAAQANRDRADKAAGKLSILSTVFGSKPL